MPKSLEKPDRADTRSCNCRSGHICPVKGQCLQKSVVYQADVKCQNTVKTYYGLTELTFKERHNKHKSSFRNPEQQHSTALSTNLSKCQNEGLETEISWSIKARAHPMSSGGKICDLCLLEKVTILMAEPKVTLNKRDKIMCKCKHKRKNLLSSVFFLKCPLSN